MHLAPPACRQLYEYTIYSVTHEMPVRFTLKDNKSSKNAVRGLNSAMAMFQLKRKPWIGNIAVRLTATQEQSERGAKYYAPVVTPVKVDTIDAEARETADFIAQSIRGQSS